MTEDTLPPPTDAAAPPPGLDLSGLGQPRAVVTMASPEAALLCARLDEDHPPDTNGRLANCRRCGFRTVGATGDRHAPVDAQVARATRWLEGQALRRLREG